MNHLILFSLTLIFKIRVKMCQNKKQLTEQ